MIFKLVKWSRADQNQNFLRKPTPILESKYMRFGFLYYLNYHGVNLASQYYHRSIHPAPFAPLNHLSFERDSPFDVDITETLMQAN